MSGSRIQVVQEHDSVFQGARFTLSRSDSGCPEARVQEHDSGCCEARSTLSRSTIEIVSGQDSGSISQRLSKTKASLTLRGLRKAKKELNLLGI